MSIQIDTILIRDNFRKDCECPMCELEREIDDRLCDQFLNEAVMEDHARDLVNKRGFCKEHLEKLYAGDNKLGFALQLQTRMKALLPFLTGREKAAKKTAAALSAQLSTCLLCDLRNEHVARYAEGVADLWQKEEGFRKQFEAGKGFCLEHYALLLSAGGSREYVAALQQLQAKNMDRLMEELDGFIKKFDYRYASMPWGNSKDAHLRVMQKYHGK